MFLTRLKVGLRIKYSDKWSGTYLLLPKVASDYINVTTNDLYLGGEIVFKYQKKENLNYKFGMYASNEAYGLIVSPLLGMYYKSPNTKFEMNVTLPTDLDLYYSATQKTKIGIDYSAVGKSYRMTTENRRKSYAENNSLQFSTYIQNNSIFKNILFRIKAGFSTNEYEVYPINQKIDLRISAFKFGDHQSQINTILPGSPIIMFESIYRSKSIQNKTLNKYHIYLGTPSFKIFSTITTFVLNSVRLSTSIFDPLCLAKEFRYHLSCNLV